MEIVGLSLFVIGLVLFAVAGLADFSYWIGASIALLGLILFLLFVALRKYDSPMPKEEVVDTSGEPIEEIGLMPKRTRSIRCPRCNTSTTVEHGVKPHCDNCGFH